MVGKVEKAGPRPGPRKNGLAEYQTKKPQTRIPQTLVPQTLNPNQLLVALSPTRRRLKPSSGAATLCRTSNGKSSRPPRPRAREYKGPIH